METLRFLMVTTFYPPYHIGDDTVHVRYLAEALAERGHEVHVEYAPAAYFAKGGWPVRGEGEGGVHHHPIPSPFGGMQPLSAYLRGHSPGVDRFHEGLVRAVQPDVIHYHNISLLGPGVVSGPGADRKLYTAHDYWLRCQRGDLFKYGCRPCETATCGRCAIVSRLMPQLWRYGNRLNGLKALDWAIAPTDFMKRSIENELECPVVTIPNFAPDPNPRVSIFRPDEYYLYVGAFEAHKGLKALAAGISGFEDHLRFVFVGRGTLKRQLRKLSDRHDSVDVIGWLQSSRIAPFYRGARGLIIPSLSHENAPLAAIEALSWGTPLLVSNRGGLEELVDSGAGISFEPTSPAIHTALEEFEAGGLPFLLRQRARLAYEARHHPVRYLERYMVLIEEEGEEAIEKMGAQTVAVDRLDSLGQASGGIP